MFATRISINLNLPLRGHLDHKLRLRKHNQSLLTLGFSAQTTGLYQLSRVLNLFIVAKQSAKAQGLNKP